MTQPKNNKQPYGLPSAVENFKEIVGEIGSRQPILFLDYDGTLTPIVDNPEEAILSDEIKKLIKEIAEDISVVIISGRDRENVELKVGLSELIYAGSHGFDIVGPNGLEMQHEQGQEILPTLDEAEGNLNERLDGIAGVQVERKKYAIAVHYRNVEKDKVPEVKKAVLEELDRQPQLKKGSGKKILELKPELDWDKGKALTWLIEALGSESNLLFPVYIGDDITDEDAFEEMADHGIGIIVGSHDQKTRASYGLRNVAEVLCFLEKFEMSLKRENIT
ncbi:alpha,alpha-trehalase [Algoriphagus sp. 4150]|uniref:trehalose-phosphatase n=1 Tax=Algoriphagus sp. 4150 TaxID=2817756 RepID=UPI00285A121C|nr:trehalose-phosphatase [Algoriphagus sp. 4150]MDR7127858.1 alpha,alpha-trehalase [Algoriphagus sp. 4150]